ncbi:MAG: stage III sporulation AC/AD family protein [Clostridia bacterium]
MDIIKIIGVGLIALIIIIILKQYRPEFVIYVSIIAGVIILILIMDKVSAIIDLLTSLSNKTVINNEFLVLLIKEFSSSPICNPLSKGTDTIPPNILLK